MRVLAAASLAACAVGGMAQEVDPPQSPMPAASASLSGFRPTRAAPVLVVPQSPAAAVPAQEAASSPPSAAGSRPTGSSQADPDRPEQSATHPAPAASAPAAADGRAPGALPPAEPRTDVGPTPQDSPTASPANPVAPGAVDKVPEAPPPIVGTDVAPPAESVEEAPSLHEDLWARLRQNYAVPKLDSEVVRKWEQYYSTKPDYLKRMFERGGRYLFHIVEEVGRRGMPTELALLPFVESAFNPHAVSSARASGIWQFMPATGRHFELRQNLFRDDRRSVLDSTRAALDYLQQLHSMFGDWQLALAAYNWGQGNVAKALANNRRAGLGTRYADLTMPDETRNYVPKLQAISNLVERPDQFSLELPPLQNHPYFLTVNVDRDIDVAVAARLAGLPLEEFQALNPQMNKPVILAAGTPQILLPFDNARRYQREVLRHRGPFATWTAWTAPRTLRPEEAARAVGMTEQQLRDVNRIPPRMPVKAGSTLLVPRTEAMPRDASEHVADTASMSLTPEAQPGRRQVVKVGPKGESVAALAQRYRLAPAQLASWNGVPARGSFKAGQQVVMFVTAAPARTAKAGRSTAASPATVRASASARASKRAEPARRVAKAPARPLALANKR